MIIEIIQEAADVLRADPYFSNVGVVSEDLGDPQNAIDTYVSTLGIGCVLMTPKVGVAHPDVKGPYFDDIDFILGVFENVKMNRGTDGTKKPALAVAEVALALLHQHKPTDFAETIIAKNPAIVVVPHKTQLVYNCFFKTEGGLSYAVAPVATPTSSVVDNGDGTKTITLACATTYAYTFYTTDGRYPSPRDPSGNPRAPYAAPFVVPTGTKVLARAWLPGYLASQLVTINA